MKNKIKIIIPVILVLIILSFILYKSSEKRNAGEITGSGTIEAVEVTISSKISGEIEKLYAEEGDNIKKDDLIAVIDHSSLDIQLDSTEAGYELADSQLKLLLEGARAEDIKQAEEGLKQAEANFNTAETDLKRQKSLYASDSISKKQLEDAEARYTISQAQYDSAKQALKKLQEWARPEEIRSMGAKLKQAKASVEMIKKNINDCYIKSPLSGVVTNKLVEQGELATQGTGIVTISNLAKLDLKIYISELELGKVKIGQEAEITIDSAPGRIFAGKVIYISPVAEFTPKNIQTKEDRIKLVFAVKIEIENKERILKSGMPADARIMIQNSK